MDWYSTINKAEKSLRSHALQTSEEIISLIKKVNPTNQDLPESEKIRGYELKGELQNLLLENYGDSFMLTPHPFNQDIVLIKHRFLPSVDACHADIKRLSAKAFSLTGTPDANQTEQRKLKQKPSGHETVPHNADSLSGLLKQAQALLEDYDYDAAVEALGRISVSGVEELPVLLKALRILLDDTGSYDAAIHLIKSQAQFVFKDKTVREMLALAYSSNSMVPEARVIYETIPLHELSKESMFAYAYIAFKDGNLLMAFNLVKLAEQKDGFINRYAGLKAEIERCLLQEVAPLVKSAQQRFAENDFDSARSLALDALRVYPDCKEAIELVGFIDAMHFEGEIRRLWKDFEHADGSEKKLDILRKLRAIDRTNERKIKSLIASEKDVLKENSIKERVDRLKALADVMPRPLPLILMSIFPRTFRLFPDTFP